MLKKLNPLLMPYSFYHTRHSFFFPLCPSASSYYSIRFPPVTVRSGIFGCITCVVMYVSGYLSSYNSEFFGLLCDTRHPPNKFILLCLVLMFEHDYYSPSLTNYV